MKYLKNKRNVKILIGTNSPINIKLLKHRIDSYLNSSLLTKEEIYVKAGICSVNGSKFFVKKYINRGIVHSIKNFFRKSKAEKNLILSEYLLNSDVVYPKAYGVLEEGGLLQIRKNYLITEAIDNIADDEFYDNFIFADKKNLLIYIKNAAKQISLLHEKNIFHGDCKRSNFYITEKTENYKLGLLDFDGSIIYKKIPISKRAGDLGRFIAAVLEHQFTHSIKLIETVELLAAVLKNYTFNGNENHLRSKISQKISYHLKRKNIA